MNLDDATRNQLRTLARDVIRYGVAHGTLLPVRAAEWPTSVREPRATFVTLEDDGQLRGCIGILEAVRPLVEDIAYHAYAAAFQDSRFPPVDAETADRVDIHISVLSPPAPLNAPDEAALIRTLRPGIDGLILEEGRRRATFLPSVWDDLPDPAEFVRHLKRKGGWPGNYWSDRLLAFRYTTESL